MLLVGVGLQAKQDRNSLKSAFFREYLSVFDATVLLPPILYLSL